MPSPIRFLIAIAGVAALTWCGAVALDLSSARRVVDEATLRLGAWSVSPANAGDPVVDRIRAELEGASVRRAADPASHELLGVLLAKWPAAQPDMERSLREFTAALALRPTSPYAWSNMAQAKYSKGDSAQAIEVALGRAAQLGPAEPEVQRTVADFGLALWNDISPASRTAVERVVADGMRRNPMETLRIAARRGRLDVACRHLAASRNDDPRSVRRCQGTEASP